jgi:hypothetical protein
MIKGVSLEPLPMEQYSRITSERERSLQAIGDCVAYWLKWTTREFKDEGMEVTPDTHIWLNGHDGCPPHWPSVGQLTRWLEVLRDSDGDVKQAPLSE